MSEVVIYEKVRSCPYCGAFKKKDGWNYAKQMCGCGFGKIPTPEEIEADDYSTAQVQNMHREITTLTTELAECRAENERLDDECEKAKDYMVTLSKTVTEQGEELENRKTRCLSLAYNNGRLKAENAKLREALEVRHE